MSDYQHALRINAPADTVFDYVSDVRNLPDYLPTLRHAEMQGADRVRVEGHAGGREYANDGFFKVDRDQRRMEWGSDGENEYRGRLEVMDADGGQACDVRVNLAFTPRPEQARQFEAQTGDRDRTIRQGLESALFSIKNACEGHGGKVEYRTART